MQRFPEWPEWKLKVSKPTIPWSSNKKGLLLVNKKMESLSWYPRGMNMDGSISATCKGWVIFVLLPEECTNYVKMSTGFLTWLWVIPFKKIKNVQSQYAKIIQYGHIERIGFLKWHRQIKIFQEYNFFFF